MKIKDDLVLQGMTQAAADEIEYNTMGAFKTSGCSTHECYIVKWTGNAYTLQVSTALRLVLRLPYLGLLFLSLNSIWQYNIYYSPVRLKSTYMFLVL